MNLLHMPAYDTSAHAGIPKFMFVALLTALSAPNRHVLKADIVWKKDGIHRKVISYFFCFKRNMLSEKFHGANETQYRQDSKTSKVCFNDPKRNNVLDDKNVALHTVGPYLLRG